jgi:hypothetical protein
MWVHLTGLPRPSTVGSRVTGFGGSPCFKCRIDGAGRSVLGMAADPKDALDPDSSKFLNEQDPVEKVSPETTADAPATQAESISTDPSPSEGEQPRT